MSKQKKKRKINKRPFFSEYKLFLYPWHKPFILVSFFVLLSISIILFVKVIDKESDNSFLESCYTGIVGSYIIALLLEFADNFKHNKGSFDALYVYYGVLSDFYKTARLSNPNIDAIKYTWEIIPDIIITIKDAMNNSQYLESKEIELLHYILYLYDNLKEDVGTAWGMYYIDPLMLPEESQVDDMLPFFVQDNISERMKDAILFRKYSEEYDRFIGDLVDHGDIIDIFLEDFDISVQSLDKHKNAKVLPPGFIEKSVIQDFVKMDFITEDDIDSIRVNVVESIRVYNYPYTSFILSSSCEKLYKAVISLCEFFKRKPYFDFFISNAKDYYSEKES